MRSLPPHLLVLLAFSALLVAPLTAPGYFELAHDARHTVYFMQMFDATLRDGALYPRWATDMVFGYGYPLWIILAPLPYYIAELFHLIGLDIVSAVKALDAVALIASGLAMYLFGSRVLGRDGGLVGAIAYLFIPYHIVDLYVRGAAAEFLAFVFPPLILWSLYQLMTTRRAFYAPLVALSYAGLILTHISMAVLFSPVIGGYVVVMWLAEGRRTKDERRRQEAEGGESEAEGSRQEAGDRAQDAEGSQQSAVSRRQAAGAGVPTSDLQRPTSNLQRPIFNLQSSLPNLQSLISSLSPLLALFWGFLLSAVFLLPVVAEQRFLTSEPLIGGFFDFRLHFLSPSQLVSPFWGYGYAGTNGNDQFSLQLGIMPLFLGFVALFTMGRSARSSAQVIYFALVTFVAILAMLAISTSPWEIVAPIAAFAQFPWRLLFVTASALAFLAGASVGALSKEITFPAALLFSLLMVLAMFPQARPQYTDEQFSWNTLMDFQVKDDQLLGDTVWVQKRPEDSPLVEQYRAGKITQKAVIVEGAGDVELVEHRAMGDTVRVNAASPARVMFYARYFSGWTATVDSSPVEVAPFGEQGLVSVQVQPGTHTVTTRFNDTLPRQLGAAISLLSLVAAGVWVWRTR